jgi:hypothetical protein
MDSDESNTGKRLGILHHDEIDALYGRPRFTQKERDEYFALSVEEKSVLKQLHSLKSKAFFIIQLGYFKARHMFFVFDFSDAKEDAAYIRQRYFPDLDTFDLKLSQGTRLKQQKLILKLGKYKNTDAIMRKKLRERARQAAAVCIRPVYIFRELMHSLMEHQAVAPAYTQGRAGSEAFHG